MPTLDELYGAGTAEAFAAATGGECAEVEIPGGVRVYVRWKNRSALKIDAYPDRVHFAALRSTRKNLYSDLCAALPDLFRERGVERFTASPGTPESDAILRKRGEWQDAARGIEWIL